MIRALSLFVYLALCFCPTPTVAAPLQLQEGVEHYPLGRYIDLLEDPGGQWRIDEVASEAFRQRFQPSRQAIPNMGFTDSTYWVRLTIKGGEKTRRRWLLLLDTPRLNYVDFYLPQAGGYKTVPTGDTRPFNQRDVPHISWLFRIATDATTEQQTVYLRLKHVGTFRLPLSLWSERAFWQRGNIKQWRAAAYYAALLTMP